MIKLINEKLPDLPENMKIKCDDEFVATIEISKNGIKYIDNYIKDFKNRKIKSKKISALKYKTIMIVLESPNTKEFYTIKGVNYASPALGDTGTRISNNLLYHLYAFLTCSFVDGEVLSRNLIDEYIGRYKILLVNAVQYKTKYGKNKKFEEIFTNENFQKDFQIRLEKYTPSIVINSCTIGQRELVDKIIKKEYKCKILNASHPSSGIYWSPFTEI